MIFISPFWFHCDYHLNWNITKVTETGMKGKTNRSYHYAKFKRSHTVSEKNNKKNTPKNNTHTPQKQQQNNNNNKVNVTLSCVQKDIKYLPLTYSEVMKSILCMTIFMQVIIKLNLIINDYQSIPKKCNLQVFFSDTLVSLTLGQDHKKWNENVRRNKMIWS